VAHAAVMEEVGGAPPIVEEHLEVEHAHTSTGLDSRKILMWAFLASDCMFFGSLIATYMVYCTITCIYNTYIHIRQHTHQCLV